MGVGEGAPSKEWAEVVMFVAPVLAAHQVEVEAGFTEEEVVAVDVAVAAVVDGGKMPVELICMTSIAYSLRRKGRCDI
jgi:hypothetical protein